MALAEASSRPPGGGALVPYQENQDAGNQERQALVPQPSTIGKAEPKELNIQEIIAQNLAKQRAGKSNDQGLHDKHPLRTIAFSAQEDVVITRGRFSWFSAVMMCFFVITGFAAVVLMLLSLRNTSWNMVSEEVSYIDAPNPPWDVPPWGYVKQPDGATERKIGRRFRYAMPQFTLFYSIFSASFGLFTVSYFCSELLVQDMGVPRVKNMGDVVNSGVDVYLFRTVPIVILMMVCIAGVIYFVSGLNFVISMLVGSMSCLVCTNTGINMNFEGGTRLTHAMNYDLVGSIQLGIRTGAIGGLAAHSMAQLGVVMTWIVVRDANSLVGFGMGVSIVSFYTRIAGGIFAKGCDIGSDFVSAMIGEDVDDYNMDAFDELRKAMEDKDGDGEIDDDYKEKNMAIDPNAEFDELHVGFITSEETKIRQDIETQMEKMLSTMHPVNYLDAIGENLADIGGTAADLFETMCITLATAVVLGGKAHEVPYFGTSLPFNIISTGTVGCSCVCYYVWCHEKHTANRIRRSLQLNLLVVIIIVELVTVGSCYLQYKYYHTITFERMQNYCLIVLLGLVAPEACAAICEYFTSVNYAPVKWIAKDAELGMVVVVLRGLGQGFASAGIPSIVNIFVQIVAFQWEGFYGLVLLACASQACTGWQATLAAYGAVANNSNRFVHLTTVNEMAHHRANVCASIGTTTSHNGKCIAGQNAFFATTALLGALLADKYTVDGQNYKATVGQEASEWSRAGLLAGILFTMLFLANTLTSSITMAKELVAFCKDNPDVVPRADKVYPATHIVPLKNLVQFASVESFRLTISPMLQSFAAPLVIGQLFGFKGLIMLVSGGNSVCFTLNMFLINSGQAWDAARKYILFGMFRDEKGNIIGAESEMYDTLGIGEQIGGPLEDLSGPGLNNFIKFIAVSSFVTSGLYDQTPGKTWHWGLLQIVLNFVMVSFFKWGLRWAMNEIEDLIKRRREQVEYEEGTQMLREIEAREKDVAARESKAAKGSGYEVDVF